MRQIVSSVTRRGQVTIPATVRRHLGVDTPDKIAFVLRDDGQVVLEPVKFTAASLSGIVPAFSQESPGDFRDIIEAATEENAAQVVAKMQRQ